MPIEDNIVTDDDTKKIIADMRADGIEIPAAVAGEKKGPSDEEKAKAEAEAKVKEEAEAKAKQEAEAKAKAEEEAKQSNSPKIEDEEGEEKEGRKPLFIPVGQAKAEKKTLENKLVKEFADKESAFKQTIDDLTAQLAGKTPEQKKEITSKIDDKMQAFADQHGVTAEFVQGLMDLFPKPKEKEAMSEEDKETLRQIREKQEAEFQTNQFNTEFVGSDEKPGVANNEELKKLVEDRGYSLEQARSKLYDFVFSTEGEAYAKIPLAEILQIKIATLLPAKKKSAEQGRGGTATTPGKQFSKKELATPEEIAAMSTEEFEKYSNEIGKGSPNVYSRKS